MFMSYSISRLLQLLEDPVESDRVAGDRGRVGASSQFGERARAGSLLKNLHQAVIHRRARREDVIVARESVHPGGASNGRLRRADHRKLRKVERIAAGRVSAMVPPEDWRTPPERRGTMEGPARPFYVSVRPRRARGGKSSRIASRERRGAGIIAVFVTQPERPPMNPTGVFSAIARAGVEKRRSAFRHARIAKG